MRGICKRCRREGHQWVYRNESKTRRFCEVCGYCERLAFYSTRYDIVQSHWFYEMPYERQTDFEEPKRHA